MAIARAEDKVSQDRAVDKFLAIQAHLLDELPDLVSAYSRRHPSSAQLRIFSSVCAQIAEGCQWLSTNKPGADLRYFGNDLLKVSTALRKCGRKLGQGSGRYPAIEGHRTALQIFDLMDEARMRVSNTEIADVHIAIGDLYFGLNRIESAIAEYRRADFLLRGVRSRERRRAQRSLSRLALKLANSLAKDHRFQDADSVLEEFEAVFAEIRPQNEREVALLGGFVHDRGLFAGELGRTVDARTYFDQAIEVYLDWSTHRASVLVVTRLAEAYRSLANLLEERSPGDRFLIARLCAFYLRYKLAERTDFRGASRVRLINEARRMMEVVRHESSMRRGSNDLLQLFFEVRDFVWEFGLHANGTVADEAKAKYAVLEPLVVRELPEGVVSSISSLGEARNSAT